MHYLQIKTKKILFDQGGIPNQCKPTGVGKKIIKATDCIGYTTKVLLMLSSLHVVGFFCFYMHQLTIKAYTNPD